MYKPIHPFEIMEVRHSVRQYKDQAIEPEKRAELESLTEFPIVKDTTPNMMNPRLYTTSYNKPQGQQFDDTAVLSFIKLQYT